MNQLPMDPSAPLLVLHSIAAKPATPFTKANYAKEGRKRKKKFPWRNLFMKAHICKEARSTFCLMKASISFPGYDLNQ